MKEKYKTHTETNYRN